MTKKNYEAAAALVREVARWDASGECVRVLEETFGRFFAADNPRFDRERFERACVPGAANDRAWDDGEARSPHAGRD